MKFVLAYKVRWYCGEWNVGSLHNLSLLASVFSKKFIIITIKFWISKYSKTILVAHSAKPVFCSTDCLRVPVHAFIYTVLDTTLM